MSTSTVSETQRRIGRFYVTLGALREGTEWAFWLGVIVWWIDVLALSPFQLVLMGIVLSVTVVLTETPTGVVADMYSRKWSMAIGMILMGLSYAWVVASRNFWVILPAQSLFAVGWTFSSGADIAWLTDELRGARDDSSDDDIDHMVEQLLLRRHRIGMMIGAGGAVFMMIVGSRHLVGAVLITALVTLCVGIAWATVTPEDHFHRAEDRATFTSTLKAGLANVQRRPRLQSLVIMALLISLAAEALDRFAYVRFIDAIGANDESIVVTGVLFLFMAAAGLALNLIVTRYIGQRDRTADGTSGRNPMVLPAIIVSSTAGAGALVTALAPGVALIGVGMMVQDSTRETLFEVINAWTNREVDSSARATVHSLIGQAFAVGEIAGGVALGLVAEWFGIPTSLFISGCLFFVAASVALPALRASEMAVRLD